MAHDKDKSCDGCPDRVADPNCHDYCKGYKRRVKRNEKVKAAKRKDTEYIAALCEAVDRTQSSESALKLAKKRNEKSKK